MKVETRIFNKDTSLEKKLLILLPTKKESKLLDFVFGSQVNNEDGDGIISPVTGVVKLSDGYGTHYIQLQKANNEN